MFQVDWAYVAVTALASLGGAIELVARYRDAPWDALRRLPAIFYVTVNALAGLSAIVAIDVFGWSFGFTNDGQQIGPVSAGRLTQVLVAGLGAMALIRSAVFTVRTGNVDIDVGPHALLKVLLDVTDRAVDRSRARRRAELAKEIMVDVTFNQAKQALPAYCFALMQNVSKEEQTEVADEVAKLEAANLASQVKEHSLALVLLNVVGEHVLRAAVESLATAETQPE